MSTVLECGEEPFQVTLGKSSLNNFITASFLDHCLHFVDRDVAVLVSVYSLTKVLFKLIPRLELVLEEAVHFDELSFDHVEFVCGHVL